MSIAVSHRSLSCIIPTLLLIFHLAITRPINAKVTRKLDETGVQGASDPTVKCGECYSSPPPPPPPPPPPSPPKKPPTTTPYCPPPPTSPGYVPPSTAGEVPPFRPGSVYPSAPPGQLYPVVRDYSKSSRNLAPVTITFGLAFFGFLIV